MQSKYNVDFTPAAYKHLFGRLKGYEPKGKGLTATKEVLADTGWKALVPIHGDGNIEVKICTGDISQIKQQLLTESPANINELPSGIGSIDSSLFS